MINDPGQDLIEEQQGMTDDEVLGIVQREQDSALGWWNTYLQEARRADLKEYFGNQRGDEREGRSQVVTRDTFEQVECLLPQLMEIFTSSNEIVSFEPQGSEDVDMCQQITETVNYIFRRENGFMVLYTMFKDALIQKNGIVKVWYEETAEAHYQDYEGKPYQEYVQLGQDPDFEITGITAMAPNGDQLDVEQITQLTIAVENEMLGPEWLMALRFDIEGKHINSRGRIRLDNIPPEEFLINRDARGLHDDTCRFVGQRVRVPESTLIAWGMDPGLVERIPTSHGAYVADQDTIVRASQDDSNPLNFAERQDSERQLYVIEAYIKIDRDGDGISEWHRVLAGGDYAQIMLETEPVNGHPFCSVTPIPVPHRFFGLSIADVLSDIQNIDTNLWRQYLDSLYLSTDPRWAVMQEGAEGMPMADVNSLLDTSVGGIVYEYQQNAIRPLLTQDAAQHVLPAFEIHEKMKQARTGVSPDAMGVNPDAISNHVFGTMVQTSAAAQRISLYAKVFAETGVPDIFRKIYKLLCTKPVGEMMVRLRGDYIPVDPSGWKTGFDCAVSVGLGHGSKLERAANAEAIGAMQEKLLTAGFDNMVTQQHLYNTASIIIEARGFKDIDSFVQDPAVAGPPTPQEPDPAQLAIVEEAKIKWAQIELSRLELELDRKKAELEHEREVMKMGMEKEIKDQEFQLKLGDQRAVQ